MTASYSLPKTRTGRNGSAVFSIRLTRSLDVLVFPRLNTLPFDGLEPSREIAGRRSSVLRRLAKTKKPVFLVSTAEAIMERLPLPASWGRHSINLKVGATYAEQDLQTRLEALGYDLDEEAEYPGTALFHGKTFEIFPAGALSPYRIEHSGGVDPEDRGRRSGRARRRVRGQGTDRRSDVRASCLRRASRDSGRRCRTIATGRNGSRTPEFPSHAEGWLSTIEEAAGRKEAEREYLGREEWKKLAKRMSVLPRKAALTATPDFSKMARRERLSAPSSPIRNGPDRGCSSSQRLRTTCVRWSA